jgi:hypothetical protein
LCLFCFLRQGLTNFVQAGLEFVILLPPPPEGARIMGVCLLPGCFLVLLCLFSHFYHVHVYVHTYVPTYVCAIDAHCELLGARNFPEHFCHPTMCSVNQWVNFLYFISSCTLVKIQPIFFLLLLLLCCIEVHCSIYKGSYQWMKWLYSKVWAAPCLGTPPWFVSCKQNIGCVSLKQLVSYCLSLPNPPLLLCDAGV